MNWIEWVAFGLVTIWVVGVLANIQARLKWIDGKINAVVREQYALRRESIEASLLLRSQVTGTPYLELKELNQNRYEELETEYRSFLERERR